MTVQKDNAPSKEALRKAREEKRATALRENLKRRKAKQKNTDKEKKD